MKVLVVFGTRPEAIKMCPLIMELKSDCFFEVKVCLSGQHNEMLAQVMEVFKICEDYNLHIMKESQSLTSITTEILLKLDPILEIENPDLVLVHGDTTTSFAAALASFYKKIPVAHIEAGLRTNDIYSPFPEEMNRQLTDQISSFHFAPTSSNADNLERQGITKNVFVTGNTVIDSFKYTVSSNYTFKDNLLKTIDFNKRVVLITAHRRENWGLPLENICAAVKELAYKYGNCIFLYPVHLNPVVQKTARSALGDIDNVILLSPLSVIDLHNLISRCFAVMTDSGGLQEEAPHFGKPVLVLREKTERNEAVEAGTVKLVGTDLDDIIREMSSLFDSSEKYATMSKAVNPYGDGKASARICKIIKEHFKSLGLVHE